MATESAASPAPPAAGCDPTPAERVPRGQAGPGGLRRRRLLRSAAGLLAVTFVLTTAKLFVFPKRDVPTPVDAVVMFAGSSGRLELAISLARYGYAPVLAVSQPTPDDLCPPDTIPNVEVICFHPRPLTTQGEARWVATAAAARGWRSIIVVTSTTQDSRARLRLSRCYDGEVKVTPVDPPTRAAWAYMITYEWAAMAKALVLQRGC
ncbi:MULTISPECIES: hypothetical protein [Pseudofrankia]|uniref:hypothetical protein n=1 Tax=Pseudofrankia TaxID=2994363 RepID=UPI000234C2FB|nr:MULTISPECIES: hypothetical protein [Pseudofrankia]OHV32580.1 hypothetical protein BCD49_28985 [Pseudofrankia sp. EUN1h]